ncbi:hypothetical protein FIBSPDRAFT_304597 [Athelia psychrophila]|uniref:Uncharacterized protein n=1 Tax=Athelia psychrophila TaxID=1759441 RepID=A0A167WZZ1_9AGAM|nr:hypothetical protein FIBSPDRAFT_304597 [Fibularhizoctonia sp. CBS 109695]
MGDDHAARAYPHLFIRFEHTLKLVIAAPAKPYHQLNLSGPNIPAHNDLEAKLVAVLTMTDPSGVKVYGIGEKARVLGRRRVRERTKGIREAGCGGLASVMARIRHDLERQHVGLPLTRTFLHRHDGLPTTSSVSPLHRPRCMHSCPSSAAPNALHAARTVLCALHMRLCHHLLIAYHHPRHARKSEGP